MSPLLNALKYIIGSIKYMPQCSFPRQMGYVRHPSQLPNMSDMKIKVWVLICIYRVTDKPLPCQKYKTISSDSINVDQGRPYTHVCYRYYSAVGSILLCVYQQQERHSEIAELERPTTCTDHSFRIYTPYVLACCMQIHMDKFCRELCLVEIVSAGSVPPGAYPACDRENMIEMAQDLLRMRCWSHLAQEMQKLTVNNHMNAWVYRRLRLIA